MDTVSKANWPAARVRNVAEALSDEMYLEKPPRMSRDKALEWMADACRLKLTDLLLMSPVVFAMKYIYGGHDNDYKARRQACEMVHGTGGAGMSAYYGNDNYDAAPAWQVDLARKELAAVAAAAVPVAAEAAVAVAAEAEAAPSLAVSAGAGVYRMPTNALGRASEESETCFPVVERTGPGYDDDEVAPTANEAAETLASMLQTIKAREAAEEEADWEAIKAKRKEEFDMRLFLSDRLVAAELKMGLLTDETAASAASGSIGSTQLMSRMVAIMGKLCDME
jgi:hypothetical protein